MVISRLSTLIFDVPALDSDYSTSSSVRRFLRPVLGDDVFPADHRKMSVTDDVDCYCSVGPHSQPEPCVPPEFSRFCGRCPVDDDQAQQPVVTNTACRFQAQQPVVTNTACRFQAQIPVPLIFVKIHLTRSYLSQPLTIVKELIGTHKNQLMTIHNMLLLWFVQRRVGCIVSITYFFLHWHICFRTSALFCLPTFSPHSTQLHWRQKSEPESCEDAEADAELTSLGRYLSKLYRVRTPRTVYR